MPHEPSAISLARLLIRSASCNSDRPRPSKSWPAGVSTVWRAIRSNNRTLSSLSSALIWRDKAGWLMPRCLAAREKPAWSATTTKERNALRSIASDP